MIEYLLNHNASSLIPVEGGILPIHLAALNQHSEAVNVLATRGSSVNNDSSALRANPLYLTARNGDSVTMAVLIQTNADVNHIVQARGATALHVCVGVTSLFDI